jgi:hypothetical protein
MRWSANGAHLLLQVRCAVLDHRLEGALSGMVPSLPGNPADHFRPSGLKCFTPNIVPRPSRSRRARSSHSKAASACLRLAYTTAIPELI